MVNANRLPLPVPDRAAVVEAEDSEAMDTVTIYVCDGPAKPKAFAKGSGRFAEATTGVLWHEMATRPKQVRMKIPFAVNHTTGSTPKHFLPEQIKESSIPLYAPRC